MRILKEEMVNVFDGDQKEGSYWGSFICDSSFMQLGANQAADVAARSGKS